VWTSQFHRHGRGSVQSERGRADGLKCDREAARASRRLLSPNAHRTADWPQGRHSSRDADFTVLIRHGSPNALPRSLIAVGDQSVDWQGTCRLRCHAPAHQGVPTSAGGVSGAPGWAAAGVRCAGAPAEEPRTAQLLDALSLVTFIRCKCSADDSAANQKPGQVVPKPVKMDCPTGWSILTENERETVVANFRLAPNSYPRTEIPQTFVPVRMAPSR
jgi:hypothetical protein